MEREIQDEEMLGKDRGQGAETKSIDPHRAGTAIYKGHISYGGSRAFDILSHINYGKHVLYPSSRQGTYGVRKINHECRA